LKCYKTQSKKNIKEEQTMLIAMEGSSPTISGENNYKYYVWQAHRATTQPSTYILGPAAVSWGLSGINIRTMADHATRFIRQHEGPINLVGWSRGAAACVQVALDLKRSGFGRNIDAMFLFDPVDQDGSTGDFLNMIPDNVTNCYRGKATKKNRLDRALFPTCANFYQPGVNYITRDFNTSHGGIAGTEGGTRGDDGAGNWMWTNMRNHGVL
jgi:pimeloyl-ACP methyl ester carboxylesterase